MNISCILLGKSAIYKKTFHVDRVIIKERLLMFLKSDENKYKGDIVGDVIKIKFINHQAFDPHFEAKLLDKNGETVLNGGFNISWISIGLAIVWILIFLSLYIKWLVHPSQVEDGKYLIYFIILGVFIIINYSLIGKRKIKKIKEHLDKVIMFE